MTHSPCSVRYRKRVGWIQCKRNQNLERNATGRRAALISLESSIAGSIAEGNNKYSLHETGAGVCSNELEGVAFVSSGNSTQGRSLARAPCTAMTNLSSRRHASLQSQRFGKEISFVA